MKKALVGIVALLAACGQEIELEGRGRDEEQTMEIVSRVSESSASFVLVLEDTDDVVAAALRGQTISALERSFRSLFRDERGCRDPAAACPIDLRLVLVRPSAAEGMRIVGPGSAPSLRWKTSWPTEAGLDAYLSHLRSLLEATLPPKGALYRPLEAADDAMRLLLGLRAPRSESEAALVAEVAVGGLWLDLVLASSRDDESPLPPEAYVWPNDRLWLSTLIAPGSTEVDTCQLPGSARGRLGVWAELVRPTMLGLPCADQESFDGLFNDSCNRFLARCTEHPIAIDQQGRADCHVLVRVFDTESCKASRGWLDPEGEDGMRRPRFEWGEEGRPMRVCEIGQHEGDRLEACRTKLSCPECGSGYCRTEVEELTQPLTACGSRGGHPLDLRFTGEALVDAKEVIIRCRARS